VSWFDIHGERFKEFRGIGYHFKVWGSDGTVNDRLIACIMNKANNSSLPSAQHVNSLLSFGHNADLPFTWDEV
jgi:hypothetical protein